MAVATFRLWGFYWSMTGDQRKWASLLHLYTVMRLILYTGTMFPTPLWQLCSKFRQNPDFSDVCYVTDIIKITVVEAVSYS